MSGCWIVYGLMEPITKAVFYVGITSDTVPKRLDQHTTNRNSAVCAVIRDIRAEGNEVEFCEFARFSSEGAARHLEDALIIVLPRIFNRTRWKEGVGFWFPFSGECAATGEAT